MSRANASKSGTGIWPGAYSSSALSDASLADIVCGGGGGGGGGGRRGGEGGSCVMWLDGGAVIIWPAPASPEAEIIYLLANH